MKIEIIYTDEYISVVNKPEGLPVHKNEHMPKDAIFLNKLVGLQTEKPVFNVHRLDSKTSGLIILSHSKTIAAEFEKLFQQHYVKKEYIAIVKGKPDDEGTFSNDLFDPKKRKTQHATTHYKVLKTIGTKDSNKLSLCRISTETGRWHQIRKHFGMNGHGIIGDQKHGNRKFNELIKSEYYSSRMMLHAIHLEFTHPVTTEILSLETKIPDNFIKF